MWTARHNINLGLAGSEVAMSKKLKSNSLIYFRKLNVLAMKVLFCVASGSFYGLEMFYIVNSRVNILNISRAWI